MKIFTFRKPGFNSIIMAFNRGHAVKLIASELEKRGLTLAKEDPVEELDPESFPKGKVVVLDDKA